MLKKQFTIFLILIFILGLAPVNFSFAITQNQIDAEVQIVCADGVDNWFSGSGTIIDPKGIILTNRHVVQGQTDIIKTCFIGFIESINKEPNFGTQTDPNLAEVKYYTTTDDMDAAILYLDNPTNKTYSYVNIWSSNSDNLKFGDKIEVVGFPNIGGATITYTSGDFSGFGSNLDGTQNYIKTTALLEHGNSGGAAYNSTGQFIGIPSKVIVGTLSSLGYILSINSITAWLSGILRQNYKQEVIEQDPIIETPKVNIQDDITPPKQKEFGISFEALDNENNRIYYGNRYGDSNRATYEFSKIRFIWNENCSSSNYSNDTCINDDSGNIAGYYYYFGKNPNAIPRIDGKYIYSNDLIRKTTNTETEIKLPEIFEVQAKDSNYFILQAKDGAGNVSNLLINFQYIYEPDKFKDIKNFDIKDLNNDMIGNVRYPFVQEIPGCSANSFCYENRELDYTIKEISTNQNILYFYPKYDFDIDGLSYYTSYGDDTWWHNKLREGVSISDNFIKVTNIKNKKETNIFIKPFKNSLNLFFGKHFLLKIRYDNQAEKIKIVKNDSQTTSIGSNWGSLIYQEIDENLTNKLKGQILLQVESKGEAYYIYPNDSKKYYLGRPKDAFNAMRKLGLGATHQFITSHMTYPDNVIGKILIDVEDKGKAYYIYPKDKKAYYLGRPADAFNVMRQLGLGITNRLVVI